MNVKIKNWDHQPLKGGWGIRVTVKGFTYEVEGDKPLDVVSRIAQIQTDNNEFKGYQFIWDMCNTVWCSRDPDRCSDPNILKKIRKSSSLVNAQTGKPERPIKYPPPRHMQPDLYGDIIWKYLNLVPLAFDQEYFCQTLDWISKILGPSSRGNMNTGCNKCYDEWQHLISKLDPQEIKTAHDCAVWINKAHNWVNRVIGKPQYPYAKMISEYGAPPR